MSSHTVQNDPLITEAQIRERVATLAQEIRNEYGTKPITLLIVLKGATVFAMDLFKQLPLSTTLEFVRIRSYQNTQGGALSIDSLPERRDLEGRHVLIVDDILDTGNTLRIAAKIANNRGAASVQSCVLLHKEKAEPQPIMSNFFAFHVPNVFVVGYGLDYNQAYRGLPAIYQLIER